MSDEAKRRAMREWARAELKAQLEPLVARWSEVLAVEVAAWQVKQMKTKWGTCNPIARCR